MLAVLLRRCGAVLVLTILAGCAEIMGELTDVAEISYCSGCDWIVQEWHEGWETHNSKPYDDEAACDLALAEQARRDRDLGLRCIHEADMTKGKWDGASQWESDRVDLDWCWRCDWRIEEWDYGRWERLNSKTHKTQGLCEQALWYVLKDEPYERYRCVY